MTFLSTRAHSTDLNDGFLVHTHEVQQVAMLTELGDETDRLDCCLTTYQRDQMPVITQILQIFKRVGGIVQWNP